MTASSSNRRFHHFSQTAINRQRPIDLQSVVRLGLIVSTPLMTSVMTRAFPKLWRNAFFVNVAPFQGHCASPNTRREGLDTSSKNATKTACSHGNGIAAAEFSFALRRPLRPSTSSPSVIRPTHWRVKIVHQRHQSAPKIIREYLRNRKNRNFTNS